MTNDDLPTDDLPSDPTDDLDARLAEHFGEQRITIDLAPSDPGQVARRATRRQHRLITAAVAVMVIVGAGIGFLALTSDEWSDDEQAIQIDATGDDESSDGTDDAADADADGDEPSAESDAGGTAPDIEIQITDITADGVSPGFGRVVGSDGVYYVLSTSPGRWSPTAQTTPEEYAEASRMDTLYVYDGNGWTISETGDRFISDYIARDGVLYAVSTGSETSDAAAFGRSDDRGGSWQWSPIEGMELVSSLSLLVTDDTTVVAGHRFGTADYETGIELARSAGLGADQGDQGLTMESVHYVDHTGIVYVPTDPDDPCGSVLARNWEVVDMLNYLDELPAEEQEIMQVELSNMIEYLRPELEAAGCDWEALATSPDALAEAAADLPGPVHVTWDELGVTIPDEWQPWSGVFTSDGGEGFVRRELPDIGDREVGSLVTDAERLIMFAYEPAQELGYGFGPGGAEEPPDQHLFTTTDGVNWNEEVLAWDDDSFYYRGVGDYLPPVAGDHTFRIFWDESAFEEVDEATTEEEMAAMWPEPQLQRSIAGGPWETVTVAELAPGIDVGDKVVHDVRGTELGVFLMLSDQSAMTETLPSAAMTVLHSSNGVDWRSFEVAANWLDTQSVNGSVLTFASRMVEDGDLIRTDTDVLLVESAS